MVCIGKDFGADKWGISFMNNTHNFSFQLEEGFKETTPFPGVYLSEIEIQEMIDFLQQTLNEEAEHEESNLE